MLGVDSTGNLSFLACLSQSLGEMKPDQTIASKWIEKEKKVNLELPNPDIQGLVLEAQVMLGGLSAYFHGLENWLWFLKKFVLHS